MLNKTKFILLLLLFFTFSIFFSSCSNSKSNILKEIDDANYCESSNDCVLADYSVCPFGCYIYVNNNEVDRIKQLIKNYKGETCVYSCIMSNGVDCIENKCVIKTP